MAVHNRTDLTVAVPKSKTYGDAADSQRRQQAVPMGTPAPPVVQAPVARPRQPLIPLDAPTQSPMEPITAGANFGAGPNALASGLPMAPPNTDNVLEEIKALYQMFPNDDLADLLDSAIREGY